MREEQGGRGKGREKIEKKKDRKGEVRKRTRRERETLLRKKRTEKGENQKPRASIFPGPGEDEPEPLSRHGCSRPGRARRPSCIVMKLPWLKVSVDWTGLWFHSLAGRAWSPGAARSRRVTWHLLWWPLLSSACGHALPGCRMDVRGKAVRNPSGWGLGFPAKLSMS